MSLSRKAINFDLSTNELKKYFNNTAEAYSKIKSFMLENGFEHRQYSGYVSKELMSKKQIIKVTEKLTENFHWFASCMREIDVTDIGDQYSLKEIIEKRMNILRQKESTISNKESTQESKQENTTDSKALESQQDKEDIIEKIKEKIKAEILSRDLARKKNNNKNKIDNKNTKVTNNTKDKTNKRGFSR